MSGAVPEVAIPSRGRVRDGVRDGVLAVVRRLIDRRLDRNGTPDDLERPAQAAPPAAADGGGRRERGLGRPQEILDRALSEKVLHGWLQNRHQVLVPLTFRLSRLDPVDAGLVARFAATALLNASAADAAAQRGLEDWLGRNGADAATLAALRNALDAPEPLSRLVSSVRDAAQRERGLASFAYAVAVAAADLRTPAGRLFADYVAARLALSADAVRSVDRRARR